MASLNVLDDSGPIDKVYFIDSDGDEVSIEKNHINGTLELKVNGFKSMAILSKDLPKLIRLIEKAIELYL